jgi:Flp pilus assembly protein TadB
MVNSELLTAIAVFVLTVASAAAVYAVLERSPRPMRRRVRDVGLKIRMSEGTYVQPAEYGVAEVVDWLQRQLPPPRLDKPAVEKVYQTLQYAGYYGPDAVKAFTVIRLGLLAGGAILGYSFALLTNGSSMSVLLWTGAIACFGYLLPLYRIRSFARIRQVKLRRELPDVIDLIVVCLECGLGLAAAIRLIGTEFERTAVW